MQDCYYCENGEALNRLMIHIMDIDNASVYLFRDQTHKGKCIVVYRTSHKTEWYQLSEEEQSQFIHGVSRTAKALEEVFHPDKINYATYGDKVSHLHVHVVPKYQDGPDWSGPFRDDRPAQLLPEEEYERRIKWIRSALNGGLPAEDL